MSNGNNVTICGSIGNPPELRFTPTGQALAQFSVAVNRRWQDKQSQQWKEETDWIGVVCWAQLAENVCESLTKGSRVIVTGRFQQRTWESQDGEKRSKVEVVADEVGPSLRWASAQVVRNERMSGPDYAAGPGGPSAPLAAASAPGPTEWSEEPF